MLTATNSTTARAMAQRAKILCGSGFISVRLLEVDQHDIHRKEQCNQRSEIDEIAKVDYPRGNRLKMGEEAKSRNRVHQHDGGPGLEEIQHQGRTRNGKRKHTRTLTTKAMT